MVLAMISRDLWSEHLLANALGLSSNMSIPPEGADTAATPEETDQWAMTLCSNASLARKIPEVSAFDADPLTRDMPPCAVGGRSPTPHSAMVTPFESPRTAWIPHPPKLSKTTGHYGESTYLSNKKPLHRGGV
jgi:hypothetical protein